MIKWVAFDIDNTLYDYDRCHSTAMAALWEYARKTFSISEKEFRFDYSIAQRRVKRRLGDTAAAHNRLLYMENFLEIVGGKPAEQAMTMYDIYWDTLLGELTPFPYVQPLMKELSGMGVRTGIITDLTAHIQYRKLRRLGLESLINIIVTSEEAGREKPSPQPFELFLDKTGADPGNVLMIGDSPEKDMAGAEKAGFHRLLFTRDRAETMAEICTEYIRSQGEEKEP